MLGELKLRAGSDLDGTIKAWLMNILDDFSLPGDFFNRLLASMEEITLRVQSPDSLNRQFEYLQIVVLAPSGKLSKGHAWGFFRLERTSTLSKVESAKGHYIEYYLYLDKKAGE